MKTNKILFLVLLLTMSCLISAFAQLPQYLPQYWQKMLNVNSAADDVRRIAVSSSNVMAVSNKTAVTITLYDPRDGIRWDKFAASGPKGSAAIDMTGVSGGTYGIADVAFTDDNVLIGANLTVSAGGPLKVYIWDTLTTPSRTILNITTAPSNGAFSSTNRYGDCIAVKGKISDNTAKIIIGGNGTATQPIVMTTADFGRNWAVSQLANVIKCTSIQLLSDGTIWAVAFGTTLQHYDSAGLSLGATPPNRITSAISAGGLLVDETNGIIYGLGIRTQAYPIAYKISDGTLLATATELITLGGFTAGTANGTAKLQFFSDGSIIGLSEKNGIARYRLAYGILANGVGNTGTTTDTIQAAITAYNVAGILAACKPLLINVDPLVTFDESIDLNSGVGFAGNIAGDLIIRSATPGTNALVKVRKGPSSIDAIWIAHNTANYVFKDLILCPSLQAPLFTGTGSMLRMDQNSTEAFLNWVELYNVVMTDVIVGGDPMVKSKAEAIAACAAGPPPPRGSTLTWSHHISHWTDSGESMCLQVDNCTLYAPGGFGIRDYAYGVAGETLVVNNTLIAWTAPTDLPGSYAGIRMASTATGLAKFFTVTGDDAGAGLLNCTAIVQPNYHGIYNNSSAAKYTTKITNLLVSAASRPGGTAQRGISNSNGSSMPMVSDCIFNTAGGIPIVAQFVGASAGSAPYVWERNTYQNTTNAILSTAAGVQWPALQTITFKDSIFSGGGTKLAISPNSSTISAENCAFVTSGPNAIGGIGVINSNTNSIGYDPIYKDKPDPGFTLASFMDVQDYSYAGKAIAGANLAGGADYIGGSNPAIILRDSGDTVDVTAINFGTQIVGTTTTLALKIKNNGPGEPLSVAGSAIVTGAPYAIDSGAGAFDLLANATSNIVVGFRPTGTGTFSDTLRITSNSGAVPGTFLDIPINGLATTITSDYETTHGPKADVYDKGDTILEEKVSNSDLIEGMTGSIVSGGFHGATVGDATNLTNGVWDSNGVTVIAADNAYPNFSLEIEYGFGTTHRRIDKIVIFAGHDGDGSRAWINCKVEVDLGAGYVDLTTLKTGAFGQPSPGESMISWANAEGTPTMTDQVNKIKFTFYCVSHSSQGFFQAWDDNTTNPPLNYPNQGTIIKEIDVFGAGATGVVDWALLQ